MCYKNLSLVAESNDWYVSAITSVLYLIINDVFFFWLAINRVFIINSTGCTKGATFCFASNDMFF